MNEIAKDLLDIKAVFLSPNEPFTWASGIKSPIYCDNRLTLSYPNVRKAIANGIANIIKTKYPEAEIIMGTATAGIPHATLVADILNLPTGYVRGKAKDHGRQNQIEGKWAAGQKVVVVEDLISTGGSSIECVKALEENGIVVLGVVSIFTYGMAKAKANFEAANCKADSLVTFPELLEAAVENNYIADADKAKLVKFMEDPSDESWMTL